MRRVRGGSGQLLPGLKDRLIAAFLNEIELDKPKDGKPDGETLRQHLESLYDQTLRAGKPVRDPRLDIEAPEEVAHIVEAFTALHRRRGGGFGGVNPISYQEIDAWMRRTANHLLPWEVDVLTALDDEFVRHTNTVEKPKK